MKDNIVGYYYAPTRHQPGRGARGIAPGEGQGGEMVRAVLRQVDASATLKIVHATRGKWLRAEPVAAMYPQEKLKHAASLPELEDQMCDFGLTGLSSGGSPDRLDALVWAVTELIRPRAEPRIRLL